MTTFNFSQTATRLTNVARATERTAADYDAMVAHFGFAGLDVKSESAAITEAARTIVVAGANNDGTKTGLTLSADMLTGRDPGAKAAHRDYWKAARTVRIGLVGAIKRTIEETSETTPQNRGNALLTRKGEAATLEEVVAAWHAAQVQTVAAA